jgi:hypothetical protein
MAIAADAESHQATVETLHKKKRITGLIYFSYAGRSMPPRLDSTGVMVRGDGVSAPLLSAAPAAATTAGAADDAALARGIGAGTCGIARSSAWIRSARSRQLLLLPFSAAGAAAEA